MALPMTPEGPRNQGTGEKLQQALLNLDSSFAAVIQAYEHVPAQCAQSVRCWGETPYHC
jgi:hypothetical protein